jgi:predicted TIM-barrel fold metal-dependent hydrolase
VVVPASEEVSLGGPRVERLPAGTRKVDELGRTMDTIGLDGPLVDYWRFENTNWMLSRIYAFAGFSADQADETPLTYEDIRPGCYVPGERLKDMDVNHVEASLCFPNYSRFAGQRFAEAEDLELGLLCVKAYNDWMVEEWCAGSGGRLIPLCIVPYWNPELAAAEVLRNADRGVRAVCFTELPQNLGLPSIHSGAWEPFLSACDETESVVCMHIGSDTKMFSTGPDMPTAARAGMQFVNAAGSMCEYLTTDVLARYPRIRLLYAESQVGWLPFVLDRLDDVWNTFPPRRGDAAIPSSMYLDRVYSCMFKDKVGVRLLDLIGEDQVMFETDYPHSDGTWPHSADRATEMMASLTSEQQYKILRGNAIKLFDLPFNR